VVWARGRHGIPRYRMGESMVGFGRSLAAGALALIVATASACSGEDAPDADSHPSPQPPASVEQAPVPTLDEVARHVQETLTTYEGIATGAVVLIHVGERTRVLASGLADAARGKRMKSGDRFPIQSITKSIVATAVMQLVADRKLALDDTVEDALPGLLPQGRLITVGHLLSHRAGLHDPTDEDLPPLARATQDTLIDIAADHPLEFTPGSSGRYSNVGYEVLGRIVERVTRQPLAVALAENIFGPAGMTDSALLGSPSVKGYFDGKAIDDPYLRFVRASGGVVSTVRDIYRFYTALWAGKLLDPDLVEVMTKSMGAAAPFATDYGLGVWLNRESCGKTMGHSGAGSGFSTKAWTLPDAGRSVVVMVNDGDGYTIADSIATAALCP